MEKEITGLQINIQILSAQNEIERKNHPMN